MNAKAKALKTTHENLIKECIRQTVEAYAEEEGLTMEQAWEVWYKTEMDTSKIYLDYYRYQGNFPIMHPLDPDFNVKLAKYDLEADRLLSIYLEARRGGEAPPPLLIRILGHLHYCKLFLRFYTQKIYTHMCHLRLHLQDILRP